MILATAARTAIALRVEPLSIKSDRCKGCALCVAACPQAVLALDLDVVNALGHHPVRLTDVAHCTSCAFCARVCPDAVFTVVVPPRDTDR